MEYKGYTIIMGSDYFGLKLENQMIWHRDLAIIKAFIDELEGVPCLY